jgi:alkaline phosphatase D
MGWSRTPRFLRKGISRRHFLRGAAAASALVGVQPFLAATAEGDNVSPGPSGTTQPFRHAVASGDPLADRVIIWTRVTMSSAPSDIPVDWIMASDTTLQNVVAAGSTVASRANDYTVKVDVTGLAPATTYYYRFSTGGVNSPVGRTRTLPVGSVDRLRVGVVSCASLAQGYFNAYRRLSRRADLDLVVHVGDYIYEHGDGEYGSVRAYKPPHEITTLLDYRTRHNQYKADIDVRELHRHHPMIAVWDDHEIADNAWKDGAENHQPATEGTYFDRLSAALRAYYEWMPVRQVSTNRRQLYRSFRIGDLAELFMLETRVSSRSEQAEPNLTTEPPTFTQEGEFLDPARKIIADSQQTWLVNGLRNSTAQWKLIGQGVMLAPARSGKDFDGNDIYFNPDQWDGYKPARDRLLGAIAGSATVPPVRNAVVLTGDIHSSWGAELVREPTSTPDYTSLGVEFVATSVTSPGFDDPDGQAAAGLRALNSHLKYVELTKRGYLLLDITPQRVSGEWWYVDTVLAKSTVQTFGTALQTQDGSNRLEPGVQSASRPGAPPLAP